MRLQDYKKFITADFVNNTRRGFADWRDCGDLCMEVIEDLEGPKKGFVPRTDMRIFLTSVTGHM